MVTMIYEIDKKPFIKVENRYTEVVIKKDGAIVPTKEINRKYCSEVPEKSVKAYSLEDYIRKSKTKDILNKI